MEGRKITIVTAYITKPGEQKPYVFTVEIAAPGDTIKRRFKKMNDAVSWLQHWATARGVKIDLRQAK